MTNGKAPTSKKTGLWIAVICALIAAGVIIWIVIANNGSKVSVAAVPTETAAAAEREDALPEEPMISEETAPTVLSNDQSFGLRGNIVCKYNLTEVRGTVTNRVTGATIFDVPVYPNATSYSIGKPTSETINDQLVFNSPECSNSWLNYKVTVKYDKNGEICTKVLIDQNFKVGTPLVEEPKE